MASSIFPTANTVTPIQTATSGALSGDGSSGNKLAVNVDGVSIDVNGSNELELIGGAISGSDTQVLFFDGANNPAGDAGLTYNKTTDALTVAGVGQVAGLGVGTTGQAGKVNLVDGDGVAEMTTTGISVFGDTNYAINLFGTGYVQLAGMINIDPNVPSVAGVTGPNSINLGSTDASFKSGYFGTSVLVPLVTRDAGDLTLSTTTSGTIRLTAATDLFLTAASAFTIGSVSTFIGGTTSIDILSASGSFTCGSGDGVAGGVGTDAAFQLLYTGAGGASSDALAAGGHGGDVTITLGAGGAPGAGGVAGRQGLFIVNLPTGDPGVPGALYKGAANAVFISV